MADPIKDDAASYATQPGNGDVWNTMHTEKGANGNVGSNTDSKLGGAKVTSGNPRENATPSDAAVDDMSNSGAAGQASDELVDSVLEAEAAEIIDEAIDKDEIEAEAEAEVEASSKEADDWKDKYYRLHAEWDTYRRRQKEQAAQQKALAAEKLVTSLIPVIDDLERSIDYAQKNGEAGLLSGVEAVLAKFVDTLKKDGVDVIDPAGEAFNALEAQAVGTVDDASVPDETVSDVYQKGYKIGNKVLRPAMVTVTSGGPARPKEETE